MPLQSFPGPYLSRPRLASTRRGEERRGRFPAGLAESPSRRVAQNAESPDSRVASRGSAARRDSANPGFQARLPRSARAQISNARARGPQCGCTSHSMRLRMRQTAPACMLLCVYKLYKLQCIQSYSAYTFVEYVRRLRARSTRSHRVSQHPPQRP